MQNTMTRREFVKIAGIAGGAMLFGQSLLNVAFAAPRVDIQGFFSTQKLSNGVEIPRYGIDSCAHALGGTKEGGQVILEALRAGFKYIEAHGATSEAGDGYVLSQLPRQDVFLSLQLPKGISTESEVLDAFNEGLAKMKTDYLDLVIVEVAEAKGRASWLEITREVWRAVENLYKQKRVRSIGIANLKAEQFDEFMESCEIKPMVSQLNISPFTLNHANKVLVERFQNRKIAVSTTTALGDFEGSVYDPILQKVAQKHNKTGAQVALRWSLQSGFITLPPASSVEQAKEYADIFNFKLDARDMKAISRVHEKMKK
ncbi:aldo/keto reductase [Helicobacter bilis]|uniref:aldo/keto reductase n=1 Tax=Helicobacter bilis TaxID=37372 RepID=UPI002557D83A|nr:aldo/keto reductase [Helicobacter bilis]